MSFSSSNVWLIIFYFNAPISFNLCRKVQCCPDSLFFWASRKQFCISRRNWASICRSQRFEAFAPNFNDASTTKPTSSTTFRSSTITDAVDRCVSESTTRWFENASRSWCPRLMKRSPRSWPSQRPDRSVRCFCSFKVLGSTPNGGLFG